MNLTQGKMRLVSGGPPPSNAKLLTDRLPRKVKRHFLESELKTANELIYEYVEYAKGVTEWYSPEEVSANRQKLIWLLERLQESVL